MRKESKDSGITFENAPSILKPKQVQELLQISEISFYKWVKSGKIPGAFKLGRHWRVKRDRLKAWINSQGED